MSVREIKVVISFLLLLSTVISAREYSVIDIIGDSISAGGNPEAPVGWVDILTGQVDQSDKDIFDLWPGAEVNNCAAGGTCASEWATDRKGMLSRIVEHEPDLVIVYIGGNDFLWGYAADGIITKNEYMAYYDDLSQIVDTLQTSDSAPDIMLVNYYDLFDGCSQNLPEEYSHYRTLSGVTTIANEVIAFVADENDCYLVDGVYDSFLGHCYGRHLGAEDHFELETYMDDPSPDYLEIHPLTEGHNAISHEIFLTLAELKSATYEKDDDAEPIDQDTKDEIGIDESTTQAPSLDELRKHEETMINEESSQQAHFSDISTAACEQTAISSSTGKDQASSLPYTQRKSSRLAILSTSQPNPNNKSANQTTLLPAKIQYEKNKRQASIPRSCNMNSTTITTWSGPYIPTYDRPEVKPAYFVRYTRESKPLIIFPDSDTPSPSASRSSSAAPRSSSKLHHPSRHSGFTALGMGALLLFSIGLIRLI